MSAWTINSEPSLQDFLGEMRELFRVHKYVKVNARIGKARSIDQNSLQSKNYDNMTHRLGLRIIARLHMLSGGRYPVSPT